MSYSNIYRDAMKKATARDTWKAKTLTKMMAIQSASNQNKSVKHICFSALKQSIVPLASAAVIALVFFYQTNDVFSPLSSTISDYALPDAVDFSAHEIASVPSGKARTIPSDQGRSIEILPTTVSAATPDQALPVNASTIDGSVISNEQYDQAIILLESLLREHSENGTLPVVLTKSDIVAEGYIPSDNTVVFVLPAANSEKTLYYVYEIPLT